MYAPPNLKEESFGERPFTSTFKGNCIGIDAAHLLRDLPYLPVVEVLPAEFMKRVIDVVDWLLDLDKKVIIMFDGLVEEQRFPPISTAIPPKIDDTNPMKLKTQLSDKILNMPTSETMNALFISLVRHYNDSTARPNEKQRVLVMRAPYYSWSQLAMLLNNNHISDVIGPLELFAFSSVKRVHLTWVGDSMSYVDEHEVCAFYNVGPQEVSQAVRHNSGHRNMGRNVFIFFSPVFSMMPGGIINLVRLDNSLRLPSNVALNRNLAVELDNHFGANIWSVNKELIVQMSYGILPVAVVRAIVFEVKTNGLNIPIYPTFNDEIVAGSGQVQVAYPHFRQCLSFMHPLLVQIVYQVIDKFRTQNHSARPPEIKLDEWELHGWEQHHLPHWVSYLHLLGVRARPAADYPDAVAVHLSVRLKVLDLMGYFTHAMANEADDSGLSSFANALRRCKSQHACAGVLFIEACRTGMLSGDSLLVSRPPDVIEPFTTEKQVLHMLGARIMSLIRLRRTSRSDTAINQPWNMNVLAFTNLVRLSFGVLQQLNLVMAFNTFAGKNLGGVNVSAIYDNLIFNDAPAPYMGFVALHIFNSPNPVTLGQLQNKFPEAINLLEDLRESAEFFREVYEMVEEMKEDDSNMTQDATDMIKRAYQVCSAKLREIRELGGDQTPCPDMSAYVSQPAGSGY